jgi:5-methylcytosine-specific restriction protein A
MSGRWAGSTRRTRLPSNWPTIRANILRRDNHRCTLIINGHRCTSPATEVDHRDRLAGDHPSNLRSLCTTHHAAKTSQEGNTTRWEHRMTRPAEQHPGMISP